MRAGSNILFVVDASSIIYGWDNYPAESFPKLWEWIAQQIHLGQLVISAVAKKEVEQVCPECADWLKNASIHVEPVSNEILREALRISHLHGVKNGKYHTKGFDENDAIIMATAKVLNGSLLSNEERQPNIPNDVTKAKIPLACSHSSISINCLNFLEYIRSSGVAF